MEFLRKLFLQTQHHLTGLTASQKLAIGSCVGLIIVAMLWLANWAGSPMMVPLLDQPMTTEDLGPIQQQLDTMQVEYQVAGSTLMVPASEQYAIRAHLAQAQVLPRDTSIGFSKLIENNQIWASQKQQDQQWGLALSTELSRVLREFDDLSDARVFLDRTTRRMIGQASVVPTASVFVRPVSGIQLSRKQIHAIASTVSAAVAGLAPTNVRVADMTTGKSYAVPAPGEDYGQDLEVRHQKESYFANKIKSLFEIPGLLVTVYAELNDEATEVLDEKYGKPPILTDESESESETRTRGGEEPGVNPNTSVAISPGAMKESKERSRTKTTFDAKVDRTVTRSDRGRYALEKLSASVNVPRSYLAAVFRGSHEGKEPTDEDLDVWAKPKLESMRELILPVLHLSPADKEQVQVAWIHDEPVYAQAETVEAGTSEGMMQLVHAYGGRAGLGVLAFMSMVMMLMLVRRASEGPILPGEEVPKMPSRNAMDDDMMADDMGQAEVSDAMLMGKEVDEATLQNQKVVDQVVELVQDDPDASVSILKRWIDAEQR